MNLQHVVTYLTRGLVAHWRARELNGWIKAFGDMIDQITQRLNVAIAMYKLEKAYDDPYSRVGFQNRQIPDIRKSIRNSESRRQGG